MAVANTIYDNAWIVGATHVIVDVLCEHAFAFCRCWYGKFHDLINTIIDGPIKFLGGIRSIHKHKVA